jgi:hypothetical protein
MAVIPDLIARYAGIWYALCALGAFFYVWGVFQARRQEALALFGKEREDAAGQEQHSWMMAGVCVLLALGVYGVSNFIAPNLALEQEEAVTVVTSTPTPIVNLTIPLSPTSPPTATATSAPVPTVAPIATPLSRPPDTPTPPPTVEGQQALENVACTSAGTQITSPQNGAQLSGVVEVRGTASLPNFLSYKFELQWPNSEEWVTIQSFEAPVAGGILGYWDTSLLEPGTFKFRLVVVDNTFNYPEPCVISVIIAPEG